MGNARPGLAPCSTTALTLGACSGGSNSGSSTGTSSAAAAIASLDSGDAPGFTRTPSSFWLQADVASHDRPGGQCSAGSVRADRRCASSIASATCSASTAAGQRTGNRAHHRDPRPVTGGLPGSRSVPPRARGDIQGDHLRILFLRRQRRVHVAGTAGQVAQEHFDEGDATAPAGPLFGVQISNLPCSDINTRFTGSGKMRIPERIVRRWDFSPDPGGIPLYKAGVPVGAVRHLRRQRYLRARYQCRGSRRGSRRGHRRRGQLRLYRLPADRRADQDHGGWSDAVQYANTEVSEACKAIHRRRRRSRR